MTTADLLTSAETCDRKGYWTARWQRRRFTATEMLRKAVTLGLTSPREDYGEAAGEAMMEMAVDPGMETPSSHNIHQSVVHHAALADMLTTAIRIPKEKPWQPMTGGDVPWVSAAFLSRKGDDLRAITLASSWNDERHYSTVRSWYALGEVAHYEVPMKMVVCILGQHRDGRRTGPWTRGFLHPRSHQLRFRKKSKVTSETFSDSWEQVWREDRGDISNTAWQQAMLADDILRDVLFVIDIPVPGKSEIGRIREMAARKLERLAKLKELPEASMSVCDRPPCPFRGCCWSETPYEPSEKTGFVRVTTLSATPPRSEVADGL